MHKKTTRTPAPSRSPARKRPMPPKRRPQPPSPPPAMQRLQKLLSQAGIASRRKAEEMILAGRVRVNGQVTTELGTKANPRADKITVDGRPLHFAQPVVYLILNKPVGFVTTAADPEGRPTVMQLLP